MFIKTHPSIVCDSEKLSFAFYFKQQIRSPLDIKAEFCKFQGQLFFHMRLSISNSYREFLHVKQSQSFKRLQMLRKSDGSSTTSLIYLLLQNFITQRCALTSRKNCLVPSVSLGMILFRTREKEHWFFFS